MKKFLKNKGISDEIFDKFNIKTELNVAYFPVYDLNNNLLFTKYRYKNRKMMNPKGGKNTIYGGQYLKDYDKVIITEGETDMLAAQSIGLPAITSTSGVMSFKEEWIELLKDKKVFIWFDNDKAGHNGMARLYKMFPEAHFIFMDKSEIPNKGDLSDFIVKYGPQKTKDKLNNSTTLKDGFVSNHNIVFTTKEETTDNIKTYRQPLKLEVDDELRKENAKAVPFESLLDFDKQGRTVCPFHADHEASMMLWRKHNLVKCFVCDEKAMDTIGFIMKLKGLKFYEAIADLVGPKPKVYTYTNSINIDNYDR